VIEARKPLRKEGPLSGASLPERSLGLLLQFLIMSMPELEALDVLEPLTSIAN
jgi:hypothetical protein